jgi:hypothetical protein
VFKTLNYFQLGITREKVKKIIIQEPPNIVLNPKLSPLGYHKKKTEIIFKKIQEPPNIVLNPKLSPLGYHKKKTEIIF